MNPTTTETNGRLPKKFVLLTVSAVMIITLGVTLWVSFRVMKAEAHVRYVGISNLAAEKIAMTVRGMEMNAKNVFDEVAKQHGCQAVAVAHHQNDQAETLLLNLKRGTGLRGLAGMRPKSSNPMVANGVPVIRPLLCTTRDYIEHYVRDKRGLHWVTDSTNSDLTISRNAVREQLKTYTKAEIEHIAQTAEIMQGYIDMIEGKSTREAGIVRLYEDIREYGFAEIDKIYDALQKGEGGKVFTSKTHQATVIKGKLCITTAS